MIFAKHLAASQSRVPRAGIVAFGTLAGSFVLSQMRGWRGPVCPIWFVYHIHCPGCGLTRSLVELWRGHPWLSFRYHPAGLPLFLLCVLVAAGAILDWRLPRARPFVRDVFDRVLSPRFLSPVAGLLAILWLARLVLDFKHIPLFLW